MTSLLKVAGIKHWHISPTPNLNAALSHIHLECRVEKQESLSPLILTLEAWSLEKSREASSYFGRLELRQKSWNITCQTAPQTGRFDEYQVYILYEGHWMVLCKEMDVLDDFTTCFDWVVVITVCVCVWNTHTVITTTLALAVLLLWWLTQQSYTRLAYYRYMPEHQAAFQS